MVYGVNEYVLRWRYVLCLVLREIPSSMHWITV